MIQRFQLLIVLFLAIPFPVSASGLDIRGIGLLALGQGGCTGTLIEPDLVLTAAHCLQTRIDDKPITAAQVIFHPSTPTGQAGEAFHGKKIAMHPVFLVPGLPPERRLPRDIALIELERPVPEALATPIRTGYLGELDGKGFVISFRGQGSRARQRACVPITVEQGLLQLACEVKKGNSGSPYLAVVDGELAVIGVISSSSKKGRQPIALAADLRAGLGGLREALSSVR